MKKIFLITFVLATFLIASVGYAAIPKYVTLQGRLTDVNSNPLNGAYNFTLKIYDNSVGGNLIWNETQPSVAVTNGIFNILLGNAQPLSSSFDKDYWIEITVGTTTLSPRVQLTSSPYAYYAENVNTTTISQLMPDVYVNQTGDTMSGKLYLPGINSTIPPLTGMQPMPPPSQQHSGEFIGGGGVLINMSNNPDIALRVIHNGVPYGFGPVISNPTYAASFEGGKGVYITPNLTVANNICLGGDCTATLDYVRKTGDNMTGPLSVLKAGMAVPGTQYSAVNGTCTLANCYAVYGKSTSDSSYAGYFTGGNGLWTDKASVDDESLIMNATQMHTLSLATPGTSGGQPPGFGIIMNGTSRYNGFDFSGYLSIERSGNNYIYMRDGTIYSVNDMANSQSLAGYSTGSNSNAIEGAVTESNSYSGWFSGGKGVHISGNLDVTKNISAGGGRANSAVCWGADGRTLGYCTTAVDATGHCDCSV